MPSAGTNRDFALDAKRSLSQLDTQRLEVCPGCICSEGRGLAVIFVDKACRDCPSSIMTACATSISFAKSAHTLCCRTFLFPVHSANRDTGPEAHKLALRSFSPQRMRWLSTLAS